MQTLTTEQIEQVKRQQDGDVPLVNVLPTDEYNKAHVPGSKNIPLDTEGFENRIEQLVGNKDEPIIVYCASKECDASPKAAARLEKAGFTHVFDYEGGTEAWKQAGHEVESGAS